MLTFYKVSSAAQIVVRGAAAPLSEPLEAQVAKIWAAELADRLTEVFDGRMLSVTEIGEDSIVAEVVEYSRFVAQRRDSSLFSRLRVRPLAVSGLLWCADGLVLGRRAASTTEAPGLWELVPSGGLDTTAVRAGQADVRTQILTELREEIGVGEEPIRDVRIFALIEDPESHVLDIGVALLAPALSFEDVRRAHREFGSREYVELMLIAEPDLAATMAKMAATMVTVSAALVEEFQRPTETFLP